MYYISFNYMSNPFAAIALGVIIGSGLVVTSNSITAYTTWLHEATQEQCRNHDWPEAQHDAHIAWCVKEGYLLPSA